MAASRPSPWSAWREIHGTPVSVANVALSGFLLCSAVGVLVGGIIADRTPHHERVAAVGFACTSTMAILMAWVNMPAAALIVLMSVGGLLNGIIQPSRDMMVRAVTPPGSFGKVFGFVSTGFNLGGMVAPLLFGFLMDQHEPRAIFMIVAGFILLALVTAITRTQTTEHRPMDSLDTSAPSTRPRPWPAATAPMPSRRQDRGTRPSRPCSTTVRCAATSPTRCRRARSKH